MITSALVIACLLVPTAAPPVGSKIVVTENQAKLNSGSTVVGTAPVGAILTVERINGEYLWVTLGRGPKALQGWVWEKHVKDLRDGTLHFSQKIAEQPKAAVYYYIRGRLRTELDDSARATSDFTQVIALDPKMALAWLGRGRAHYQGAAALMSVSTAHRAMLAKAVADATEAIRLDPKLAMAYKIRGLALAADGKLAEAAADFAAVLRLDASDKSAQEMLALVTKTSE